MQWKVAWRKFAQEAVWPFHSSMGDFRAGSKKRIPYFTVLNSSHSAFSFYMCRVQQSTCTFYQALFTKDLKLIVSMNDKSALVAFEGPMRTFSFNHVTLNFEEGASCCKIIIYETKTWSFFYFTFRSKLLSSCTFCNLPGMWISSGIYRSKRFSCRSKI